MKTLNSNSPHKLTASCDISDKQFKKNIPLMKRKQRVFECHNYMSFIYTCRCMKCASQYIFIILKNPLRECSLLAMLCIHKAFYPDNLGCLWGVWLVFLSHIDSLRNSKCQFCSVSFGDNLLR